MEHNWGYCGDRGQDMWASFCPAAHGKRQSPIDIGEFKVDFNLPYRPLQLQYEPHLARSLLNNGHTFIVLIDDKRCKLAAGPLDGHYQLHSFHMHWGETDNDGSEHTVQGRPFPAELHFVHRNVKYASFEESLQHADGLAVVGVFVQIGAANSALQQLIDLLPGVQYCGDSVVHGVADIIYEQLLPGNRAAYWTYDGSLTTPPCSECVSWLVMQRPIEASSEQLAQFRLLHEEPRGEPLQPMSFNFRRTQPLNGRCVRASCQPDR